MRLASAAFLLVLVLLVCHAEAGAEGAPASFDYLYVEANEGGASGGHVAIRFGTQTFHFQHHEGGILRLHRDDASAFVHTYAGLKNRPIHVQHVAVSAESYELLRRRFNDRFLLEARQFAVLDSLQRDRDLLASLSRAEPTTLELRGGGFFAPSDGSHLEHSPSLVATLAGERFGESVIARRQREIGDELAHLVPASQPSTSPAGPHAYAVAPASFAQRATELLEATAALDVVERSPPLDAGAARSAPLAELELAPAERAALQAFAVSLERQAAELVRSSRPDWGSALLLGMARLRVLSSSVASGRLVVLDAYPDTAVRLTPETVRAHADVLPALLGDARADLAGARRPLQSGRPLREGEYGALETAANRLVELYEAERNGSGLRVASGPLVPSRGAKGVLSFAAVHASEGLPAELSAARSRADEYATELRRLYGYELLTRNCVSEVFHEIAAALADDPAASGADRCAGSESRLGGCIDPAARLRFIPFVSAGAVAEEYPVTSTEDIPSHRGEELAAMYARESTVAVFLRESNVVTSTIYQRNQDDSPFIFFTDDTVLARPFFGVVNIVAGLGASAAGLFLLPTGDTGLLLKGLRGAMFSVPELAFVNLRKGSFAYVPRDPPAATADATSTDS